MKLLFLIISSRSDFYDFTKKTKQHYLSLYPDIDYYFLESLEDLSIDYEIKENHIYTRGKESVIPNILYKTLHALQVLNLEKYDYIVRTNHSSFFIIDRLIQLLSTLPKTNVLAGTPMNGGVSGAAMYMTPDVGKLLSTMSVDEYLTTYDDVAINHFLLNKVNVIHLNNRYDFSFYHPYTSNIPSHCSHIRIRNDLEYDKYIIQLLTLHFYKEFIE